MCIYIYITGSVLAGTESGNMRDELSENRTPPKLMAVYHVHPFRMALLVIIPNECGTRNNELSSCSSEIDSINLQSLDRLKGKSTVNHGFPLQI